MTIAKDGLSERLADACGERQMNPPQLAVAAEISQATAYRYLSGRDRPLAWASLVRIARVLGVTVDWLLTGDEPRYRRHHADEPAARRNEPVSKEAAAP